jgi:hypothetical protein
MEISEHASPFVEIPLRNKRKEVMAVAIVDESDAERCLMHAWHASARQKPGYHRYVYAARRVWFDAKRSAIVYLHRFLMEPPPGLYVDHINRNTLDNRRANLRLATHSQNLRNNGRRKRDGAWSRYRGVTMDKRDMRWVAQIAIGGRHLSLGYFDSEVEAAKAFNRAASEAYGEFAVLNDLEVVCGP